MFALADVLNYMQKAAQLPTLTDDEVAAQWATILELRNQRRCASRKRNQTTAEIL